MMHGRYQRSDKHRESLTSDTTPYRARHDDDHIRGLPTHGCPPPKLLGQSRDQARSEEDPPRLVQPNRQRRSLSSGDPEEPDEGVEEPPDHHAPCCMSIPITTYLIYGVYAPGVLQRRQFEYISKILIYRVSECTSRHTSFASERSFLFQLVAASPFANFCCVFKISFSTNPVIVVLFKIYF